MRIIVLIAVLAISGTGAARMRRFTGGASISTKSASFFVSIRYQNQHMCGGALITQDLVLTIEKCFPNHRGHPFPGLSVVIATDLQKVDGAERSISRVRVPLNDEGQSPKDVKIAILVLSESILLNGNIAPIPLPLKNLPAAQIYISRPSLSAELIGLQDDEALFPSKPFKKLEVSVKRCKGSDLLCGKVSRSAGKITSFDEGSPLVHKGRIIGIALYRTSEDGKRDLFVEVHKYWKFIAEVMTGPKERVD